MKKNSFVEGTFIATFAIIIVKVLGVLYVIPFYRIIGESGGSLYSYAYNVYNLFLNISKQNDTHGSCITRSTHLVPSLT